MRWFDSRAFHGRCTQAIVWELAHGAHELKYEAAVEARYAQPFFGAPLLEIVDVIPAMEDDLSLDAVDPVPREAFAL